MIALFNRDLLLNQQGGGFYPAYLPREADNQLYSKLNGRFFQKFAKQVDKSIAARIDMRYQVVRWTTKLDSYALEHPIETLTNRFPLSESYLTDVIQAQAIPALIKGKALLALVGKDITIEDLQGEKTFLSGSSRAGKLTIDLLSRLYQWEFGFGEQLLRPFLKGQFPFVDMFPWIGKSNPKNDIGLVREYLAITQPRIVVGFSRLVSSWTSANFLHSHGLPRFVLISFEFDL